MPEPRSASTPPTPSSRTSSVRTLVVERGDQLDVVRLRMLCDVCERLGRRRSRRPPRPASAAAVESDVEVDRDRGPARERPAVPAPSPPWRGSPGGSRARSPADPRDRAPQSSASSASCAASSSPVGGSASSRAQRQAERDEPLLDAVVEVALDPPARLVRGGDDPSARRGELGLAFRVRDCGRDELGELLQSLLRVGREFLSSVHRDHAPQASLDDDRAGDLRDDAEATYLPPPQARRVTTSRNLRRARADRPVR